MNLKVKNIYESWNRSGMQEWTKELNDKVTIPFFQKELNWTRRNLGLHVQFLIHTIYINIYTKLSRHYFELHNKYMKAT